MIDLTSVCWDDPQPKLLRRQEISREARGTPNAVEVGPAIWVVDLVSKSLPSEEADALYADLLDGETDTILIRPRAFTYMHGYKGLLPSVTVGSVSSGRITLNGLFPGAVVRKGTLFHIIENGRYQIYKALDASDTSGGMRVQPALRSAAAGDDVGLTPPVMEIQVVPGTLDIQRDIKGRKRVTLTGVEVPE